MSETDDRQAAERGVGCGDSFEELLARAENLFHSADYEGAIRLLLGLQEKYVAATRLFDLMGEVLIRRGDLGEGVRYQTLFQVLSNTLRVQAAGPALLAVKSPAGRGRAAWPSTTPPEGTPSDSLAFPESHCTAAMGRQLMEQGHYDQAQKVFDALLARNPADEALRKGWESARRKSREKRVLSILERWLQSIDRLKSDRSGGA
jgi:hypothetical protein